MSNNEHLLENAIRAIRDGQSFSKWLHEEPNPCSPDHASEIWELAQWVVFSYTPSIKLETIQKMEEAYGYKLLEEIV